MGRVKGPCKLSYKNKPGKPGEEPCCFEELTVDVKERVED